VPLPDDWFMNVAFNYVKFATYSALPFVVVLTLNVAIIWRTVRVSPNLRRSFGGRAQLLPADHGGHVTLTGARTRRWPSTQATTTSVGSVSESWRLQTVHSVTSLPSTSGGGGGGGTSMTASQVYTRGQQIR